MQNKQSTPTRPLRQATRWAALCATLSLVACAGLGTSTPEKQVSQRANERWHALVAGEYSQAYDYSTAGFKSVVAVDAYPARFGNSVKWVGNEVVTVKCPEPDKCSVNMRIDYKPMMGKEDGETYSTHIEETWLLEDDKWCIFQPIKAD